MTFRIAVYSHVQVIFVITHFDSTIKIGCFKRGVKNDLLHFSRILTNKWSISHLHLLWLLEMRIGIFKGHLIPCVIGVSITRTQKA